MITEHAIIADFRGQYRFLSNFYPHLIEYEGILYPSVEHAYQAAKTLDRELREGIAQLKSPYVAKEMGRLVPMRDDWDEEHRLPIMRELVTLKFRSPTIAVHLKATRPHALVEGNTWHDNYFGNCMCGRPACIIPGANWLGKILMDVRDTL